MIIRRIYRRLLYITTAKILRFVDFFSPRIYMKFYWALIRHVGVNTLGHPRYISPSVIWDDFSRIYLGDRCVISKNVIFLTHDYSITTALHSVNMAPSRDICICRDIRIGDNVFIGMNCLLTPGSTIGDNVILGAGSVIRGRIPSGSIVTGNPCTVVGNIEAYGQRFVQNPSQFDHSIDRN